MVEITDGLDDGEHVVTIGHVGLKQDALVNVINQPDNPKLVQGEVAQNTEPGSSENATTD